jgi:uncharacterized membrane protein (DUF106 family)
LFLFLFYRHGGINPSRYLFVLLIPLFAPLFWSKGGSALPFASFDIAYTCLVSNLNRGNV